MFWTRTIKLNKPTMLISLHINFLSNNTNYKLNVIIFIKKISDTHYFGQRARSVIPNWPFPRPSTQRARDETLSQNPAAAAPLSHAPPLLSLRCQTHSPPYCLARRSQIHLHLLLRSLTLGPKSTDHSHGISSSGRPP